MKKTELQRQLLKIFNNVGMQDGFPIKSKILVEKIKINTTKDIINQTLRGFGIVITFKYKVLDIYNNPFPSTKYGWIKLSLETGKISNRNSSKEKNLLLNFKTEEIDKITDLYYEFLLNSKYLDSSSFKDVNMKSPIAKELIKRDLFKYINSDELMTLYKETNNAIFLPDDAKDIFLF